MKFHEFAGKVKEEVAALCGEGYEIEIQEVKKNNGVVRTGIFMKREGEPLGPILYLDGYYERWGSQNGSIEGMARLIYDSLSACRGRELLTVEFGDFELLKPRIVFRLLSRERNEELLRDVPWLPFCDLAVAFAVLLKDGPDSCLSFLISHRHVRLWNTDVETLEKAAVENSPRLLPEAFRSFREVLLGISGFSGPAGGGAGGEGEPPGVWAEEPCYVLSNTKGFHGAAVMLYDGVLRAASDRLGGDLIILPSSVHEVLVIPYKDGVDMEQLAETVRMINRTEVPEEEVLSDKVYVYRRETGSVAAADESGRESGEGT